MLLTMLLAAAQPAADTAPAAPSRMVELIAREDGQHCLPDGQICFELSDNADAGEGPAHLLLSFPGSGDTEKTALPLPAFADEPQSIAAVAACRFRCAAAMKAMADKGWRCWSG